MKRLVLSVLVGLSVLFNVGVSKAYDPAYIAISNPGWNCTVNQDNYWCTAQIYDWTVEVWLGGYTGTYGYQGHFHYGGPVSILFQDEMPGYYAFNDVRTHPMYAPADKAMILFTSYGVPLTYPNPYPSPQGFFEMSDYDSFWGWCVNVVRPPDGSTWAIYVVSHNMYRADEMSVSLVTWGSGTSPNDIPLLTDYEGNAQ
ncbi:MAG: hypothetical protein KBD29_04710 [Candidatus Magasanikbacteria bacterium]|nr:hypothetical protein [Candidatus Magasanikbacteria bacterium]